MASATKTFEYSVRDQTGKVVKGKVQAGDQAAVAHRLKEMGLTAVAITEVKTAGLNAEVSIPGLSDRVGMKDLAIMARQLATMISSGVSLLRALAILAEQTQNKTLAGIIAQVRNDVEVGLSLSVGLGKHPRVFPPLMINLIRAGEVGGFLDEALIAVADNFEAEVRLRGKIKSAMTYPVVVFIVAILAVVGMMLFILPTFAGMYDSFGAELPVFTRILLAISNVMKVTILPSIVVLVVFSWWWSRHKNDEGLRRRIDPWKIKAPIFGPLVRKIAVSRFTRNLGTMVASGVPLLQALGIVGQTSGNYVIEKAVEDVSDSVRKGRPLAEPLNGHPVFPPMVVQMIAIGEDTGALDTMLHKISEFYDQEVEATTESLTSLIEPLMIVVIGSVIGTMVIGMYLPIFQIFDVIQ
jgi:type IV pilus assembly protein PilC